MAKQAQELQEKLRNDAQIEIKKLLQESEQKRKQDELQMIEDERRAQEEEDKRQQLEELQAQELKVEIFKASATRDEDNDIID